jgi:dihydroxyacetone kinase-like protein
VIKKFINHPDDITMELLEGLVLAFPDLLELHGKNRKLVVNKALLTANRVGIISLGGTGHEPALSGVVGPGMLDIAVAGNIFAAPGPQDVLEAIRLADRGHGVLLIILNHTGDIMSGTAALKDAEKENINVRSIVTYDDIFSEPRTNASNRRGMVGCVLLYHIAGAAAEKGMCLEEIEKISQDFANNMATLSVAVSAASHPATGLLLSAIDADEMQIGIGQHGEGGGKRYKMMSANATAEFMVSRLVEDLSLQSGEKAMLVINGSGSTTIMEMCIVFRHAYKVLTKKGIKIVASYCGELLTTQEQGGFQMFLARMNDTTLSLWNSPCRTPYFSR